MNESQMRRRVIVALKPLGAFAVENTVDTGTPDVCCVAGWLELKVAISPEKVRLRPAQAVWLRRWARHGGRAWTLTAIGASTSTRSDVEWFLHDAAWSADRLGTADAAEFRDHAMTVDSALTVLPRLLLMRRELDNR